MDILGLTSHISVKMSAFSIISGDEREDEVGEAAPERFDDVCDPKHQGARSRIVGKLIAAEFFLNAPVRSSKILLLTCKTRDFGGRAMTACRDFVVDIRSFDGIIHFLAKVASEKSDASKAARMGSKRA